MRALRHDSLTRRSAPLEPGGRSSCSSAQRMFSLPALGVAIIYPVHRSGAWPRPARRLDARSCLRDPGDGTQHRRRIRRACSTSAMPRFSLSAPTPSAFMTSPEQRLRPRRLDSSVSCRVSGRRMAVSWVVAAIFGVLLGAPTLRLRGDYLAIVTLGFGEIVPNFFLNAERHYRRHSRHSTRSPSRRLPSPGRASQLRCQTDQRNWYWLIWWSAFLVLHDPAALRLPVGRRGRPSGKMKSPPPAWASTGQNQALGVRARRVVRRVRGLGLLLRVPVSLHPTSSSSPSPSCSRPWSSSAASATSTAHRRRLLIGVFDRILAEELNRPLTGLASTNGDVPCRP